MAQLFVETLSPDWVNITCLGDCCLLEAMCLHITSKFKTHSKEKIIKLHWWESVMTFLHFPLKITLLGIVGKYEFRVFSRLLRHGGDLSPPIRGDKC